MKARTMSYRDYMLSLLDRASSVIRDGGSLAELSDAMLLAMGRAIDGAKAAKAVYRAPVATLRPVGHSRRFPFTPSGRHRITTAYDPARNWSYYITDASGKVVMTWGGYEQRGAAAAAAVKEVRRQGL